MKKLLLMLSLVALSSIIFAQAKIDEDFEDGAIPAGWITHDFGHNPDTWVIDDYDPHGGTYHLAVDTYEADSTDLGIADDWIVTSQITVNDGDVLSLWAKSDDPDYLDSIHIYISKATSAVADFDYVVGKIEAPADYTKFTFNLTEISGVADGDNIYIGFHTNTSGYYAYMDDIKVYQPTIVDEDFEEGIPNDWTVIDGGGNPNTWTDTIEGGYEGTNGVWVDTYEADFDPADDWLITPQFEVRTDDVMSFWLYGNEADYEDTIYVEISKTGVTTGDFTIHADTIYTNPDWTKYQYEMSNISGITDGDMIYVGIRAKSFGSRVFFDNFRIGEYIAPAFYDAYAISENELAVVYDAPPSASEFSADEFSLSGSQDLTFTAAEVNATNENIVILTASASFTADNTLDILSSSNVSTEIEFYAGILPIEYLSITNTTTIDGGYNATFKGIVSATNDYDRVWIADASAAHSGINTYELATGDVTVAIGDEILVYGQQDAYKNQTELYPAALIEVVSSGNDVYDPVVITGADIATSISADTDPAEQYEGSLVTIQNVNITSWDGAYFNCTDDDGTNTFYIGDAFELYADFGENMLAVGANHNITGIVTGRDGIYLLTVRSSDDITTATLVEDKFNTEFTIYPNPVKHVLNIENLDGVNQVSIINTLGQEIKSVQVTGNENLKIDVSELKTGLYFVSFYNNEGIIKSSKIIKK
ncbi:MAG: choice-of-anchor J domain-containing protein [Bacteroidetes bacterium]|nr:choice-of-anchor J domain-containing protein [Bacteroidota bacterium]